MAKIYVTCRVFAEEIERLRAAGHTVEMRDHLGPISHAELLMKITTAEALICLLSERIDAEVIAAAKNLKIIANLGVGYDNIDVKAARTAGIIVTTTPGALTEATADLTFALLLAAARRIVEGDTFVRAGEFRGWELIGPQLGLEVYGKTLGVVGMGKIGTAVARRGRLGFGMKVLYHNRGRNKVAERELDALYVPLERLLDESDFVCVHTPLTPQTHHMFGRQEFTRMKDSAILVNVARGPVVDEKALVWALETGEIAGAGIDVYEEEPVVHPGLINLRERVVLAPHIGSATEATRRALAKIAVDNVLQVLTGALPLNPVT
ncbi:D-glycerate dehydrogenase [Candidatus Acetothermia bacterium]|nr:D-glycerate dehydrogenase [Candidatus Acetothermia bacterium]MCI2428911.1 D-glycerate dehydrogenase [Candidatus Acetothermia bacterium]